VSLLPFSIEHGRRASTAKPASNSSRRLHQRSSQRAVSPCSGRPARGWRQLTFGLLPRRSPGLDPRELGEPSSRRHLMAAQTSGFPSPGRTPHCIRTHVTSLRSQIINRRIGPSTQRPRPEGRISSGTTGIGRCSQPIHAARRSPRKRKREQPTRRFVGLNTGGILQILLPEPVSRPRANLGRLL
jgi:hypothetical protein